jgi:hypothetical protein
MSADSKIAGHAAIDVEFRHSYPREVTNGKQSPIFPVADETRFPVAEGEGGEATALNTKL